MNTKTLAGLYDRLTPAERYPLILAAMKRGDDIEVDRLSASASRVAFQLPDYEGFAEGLRFLSLLHMIEQLNLGLIFWRDIGLSQKCKASPDGPEDLELAESLWENARMAGYRLCVDADALRLVCTELKVDPDDLLRDLPGFDVVEQAERHARPALWTYEEASAYLKKISGGEVPNVEQTAQSMRTLIKDRVEWWKDE